MSQLAINVLIVFFLVLALFSAGVVMFYRRSILSLIKLGKS